MHDRKVVLKAQQSIERESLLGDVRMNDLDLTSQDHQQRYADSTARLESHSAIIQDSQRMTEDTIAITTEALTELDRQRGVMERSRNRVCRPPSPNPFHTSPLFITLRLCLYLSVCSWAASTRRWTAQGPSCAACGAA